MPRMHRSRRLVVQTLVFSHSYLHRQVSPPETLVVKGGSTWARNGRWILPENARLPRNIQGSFTCRKSTTWDKRLYFLSEGRRAEDPTASAGFEPAKLGTKGQHATSRPPKPLTATYYPQSVSNTKKKMLALDKKIISMYCENHMNYPNSLFSQTVAYFQC